MLKSPRTQTLALMIAMAIIWSGAMSASAAPLDQVLVVTGTIHAVDGNSFTIASAGGAEKIVKIEPETFILSRETTTLGTIKPGDALGVAAKRGEDGSLTAISISIIAPELWSRARKGQFPMASGDVMTNAVVMQVADRVEGRTLYLKYNDGAAAIIVPAAAEIHRVIRVRLDDLKQGMQVTVRGIGNPDGTIKASTITFDRHGQG
jgi:Domain of unknown function (DUF5666)